MIVLGFVGDESLPDAMEVGEAAGGPAAFLGGAEGGDENGDKGDEDGDDDEEFNQGEGTGAGTGARMGAGWGKRHAMLRFRRNRANVRIIRLKF